MTNRPRIGILVVVVHHQRSAGLDDYFGHVIAGDVRAALGDGLERGGVDDAVDGDDLRIEFLRGQLELVARPGSEVAAAHPEQPGPETVGLDGRVRLVRAPTWPRSTKICSVSVMPMDSPALGLVALPAPAQRSMLATTLVLLLGEKTIWSPTLRVPDSMRPAMIRRASKR